MRTHTLARLSFSKRALCCSRATDPLRVAGCASGRLRARRHGGPSCFWSPARASLSAPASSLVPLLFVSLCVSVSQSSRKLLPLFDRILIRRVLPQTRTAGGLLLPESSQTKLNEGVVVAVGPGNRNPQTGAIVPVAVKTGDSVLLPEYGQTTQPMRDAMLCVRALRCACFADPRVCAPLFSSACSVRCVRCQAAPTLCWARAPRMSW